MNLIRFYSTILFSFLLVFTTYADSEISNRMKSRLPNLMEAKDKGLIGENTDGLLLVKEASSGSVVKNLVQEENKDRILLFKFLAQKTGAPEKKLLLNTPRALQAEQKKGIGLKILLAVGFQSNFFSSF